MNFTNYIMSRCPGHLLVHVSTRVVHCYAQLGRPYTIHLLGSKRMICFISSSNPISKILSVSSMIRHWRFLDRKPDVFCTQTREWTIIPYFLANCKIRFFTVNNLGNNVDFGPSHVFNAPLPNIRHLPASGPTVVQELPPLDWLLYTTCPPQSSDWLHPLQCRGCDGDIALGLSPRHMFVGRVPSWERWWSHPYLEEVKQGTLQ